MQRERTDLLAAAHAAALRAGEAIVRIEREGALGTRLKADRSVLTEADLAANALIVAALRELDPRAPIVSEEGCTRLEAPAPRFWLVDPLDGTREFVSGNGEYTVNIALIEDGCPVLGVVHAPAKGLTYTAVRGAGAERTEDGRTQPIRARADGPLVVVASRSHPGPALGAFLAALPPHHTLAMGSSLKICRVADGTASLYPRLGPTSWWDTAAAHAVVREAGASLCGLDGRELRYEGAGILNPPFVCAAVPHAVWTAAATTVSASEQA
ncbi:MAG TPA: 3'(2'),5'-bisphosphate nucleotidase CysQ [Candidatus Limnocylindria bacterium]|nr:3'(2'),5'-bisphosphate nucleotidase CysQ [Candidatus Limnocylindria bacterium]